jgi:tetratricopeptide (TPR) repeat protein
VSHTEDQLWELLREAGEMPYGAAQIALVEQIIPQADAQRLTELSFEARLFGTGAYVYGGEPAKSVVTFSWCLTEYGRDPSRYGDSYRTLLWHFKDMVNSLRRFPEIPLDHVRAVLEDMAGRWHAAGYGPHAVYAVRHSLAAHLGELDAAQQWFDRWRAEPRNDLSDCVGCDPTAQAGWLIEVGRDEEAVALAEPVLAGRLTCVEQPQSMLTTLLLPYLRTGRLDQARDAHRQAYLRHRPRLADLTSIAEHVQFCARTGNDARAVEIVERHLPWLDRAPSPFSGMVFAASAALALARAAGVGDRAGTIRRPAHRERPAATPGIAELAAELAAQARATAARFDIRNGTGRQGELIEAIIAADQLVDYLPLSGSALSGSGLSGSALSGSARRGRPSPATAATRPPAAASDAAPAAGDDAASEAALASGSEAGPATGYPGRPTGAQGPAPIPDTGGPDELLDLASARYRADDLDAAFAAWHAFDGRYGSTDLTVLQRSRRLDGRGLEHARRGGFAAAVDSWREAVDGYARSGDEQRRQRGLGRIGHALCEMGRADTGLPMIESSTDYLLANGSPELQISALFRLAIGYTGTGRFEDAFAVFDQIAARIAAAEIAAADPDQAAQARSDAAKLALIRTGTLLASGALESALAAAREARQRCLPADRAGRSQASFIVAAAAERLGDRDSALAAYEEVLAEAVDRELRDQVLLMRAVALAGSARAAEAVDDLVEAVARFTAAGDDGNAAMVKYHLAVAYLNCHRLIDAAEAGEDAVAGLSGAQAVEGRHLLSVAYQRLNLPEQAVACLEVVQADCAARGDQAELGQISEEIAGILDQQDQDAAAARQFDAAARAYGAAGLRLDEVRARRRHSTSLSWSGSHDAAIAALAEVDRLAVELPDEEAVAWERAVIHYDAGRVLGASGRFEEALARAVRAIAGYRDLGAMDQREQVERLQIRLLLNAGRPREAERVARQAAPSDAEGRTMIARLLAAALDAQDRPDEARMVRKEAGLDR